MSRLFLVGLLQNINRYPVKCAPGLYISHYFTPKLARQVAVWDILQQKTLGDTTVLTQKPDSTTTKQKKTKTSPKITLVGQNQALFVMSLEEAQKLAKRRDMHLVQLKELDSKTQRPIYKMASPAEMISAELNEVKSDSKEKSVQTKSEKLLTIGSKINEHDLNARLKHIAKWLSKKHEVRVLIQGTSSDVGTCEKIFKTIESSVQEPEIGKIVQKRTKGNVIKFSIAPVQSISTSASAINCANDSA